ncbi:uncharacterized protein LOC131676597 [Topomyia yanbarensis]|uniref:uncharacterized protein LOC131676597 n=1 Tax=Topomyia yanbarensis TaxID=2498891 RepID=UPI00273CBAFE|nr:uncharacterized protein LOC131676597 [Topomyia yanbarensis]XP_058811726.1 uncharacterized protein LOC131676597 [Topomyia yanbarensis]
MDQEGIVIESATSLIKCCKLPRLTRSIDETQLHEASFREFLIVLDDTLPKVFDLMSQYENQLLAHDQFNQDNLEFRLTLVLVIAEQHCEVGESYEFQTQNRLYRERLNQIYEGQLEQLLTGNGGTRLQIRLWEHYERVLRGKEWMFYPGDVISFIRVCEFLHGWRLEKVPELTQSVASFMLSVGISLVEYHDPEYQLFGLRLFNVLLNDQHRTMLKETNIHQVVFQNAFRLNAKAKTERFLAELWRCHFQYVEIAESERKSFCEWSKFDDIVEALLDALAFEGNLDLSSVLLLNLLKLLALDLPNFRIDDLDDVQAVDSRSHLYEPVLEQLRKYCALEFYNRRFYRWHKRLISMLPYELEKSCGSSRAHGKYMHGVNLLFVLVAFPIEPKAVSLLSEVQTALLDFIIAFKRHMRDQYARIQASTGKCDFLHSLKASVSCDKSIAVFAKNVASKYFEENSGFWSAIGFSEKDEAYQEDRIFYECLKELQSRT